MPNAHLSESHSHLTTHNTKGAGDATYPLPLFCVRWILTLCATHLANARYLECNLLKRLDRALRERYNTAMTNTKDTSPAAYPWRVGRMIYKTEADALAAIERAKIQYPAEAAHLTPIRREG